MYFTAIIINNSLGTCNEVETFADGVKWIVETLKTEYNKELTLDELEDVKIFGQYIFETDIYTKITLSVGSTES